MTEDVATIRSISKDRQTVFVDLPLEEGKVYQIVTEGIRSAGNEPMSTTTGYYTLNNLLP